MILPLSTSFMLEPINPELLRFFFYLFNLGLCNLSSFLLQRNVLNPNNMLSSFAQDHAKPKDRLGLVMPRALFGGDPVAVGSRPGAAIPAPEGCS
jgi:hypothetical protein